MRVFLLVFNGFGVGSLPDYLKFSNSYTNTLKGFCGSLHLPNFNKIGLSSLLQEQDATQKVTGLYARGRMLSFDVSFACGFEEILGDVCKQNNDNLLTKLNKNNIHTLVLSSCNNSYVDICYDNDERLFEQFNIESVLDNSVSILQLDDFAKFCLKGDIARAAKCFELYDDYVGAIIQNMLDDDLLIISGNFGVDIENKSLAREYIPILLYAKGLETGENLNTIMGNNCIAYTIADLFGVYFNDKTLIKNKTKERFLKDKDKEVWENALKYIDKIKEDIGDFGDRLGNRIHKVKKRQETAFEEKAKNKNN